MKIKKNNSALFLFTIASLFLIGCVTHSAKQFSVRRSLNNDGMTYSFKIEKAK